MGRLVARSCESSRLLQRRWDDHDHVVAAVSRSRDEWKERSEMALATACSHQYSHDAQLIGRHEHTPVVHCTV